MTLSGDRDLTERVIGLAIDVHRHLGPGLLESAYEECLCFELKQAEIEHRCQVPLPVIYKDVRLHCGYRIDIVVKQQLIIEIKATERILPVHGGADPHLSPLKRVQGWLASELQQRRS